jgi:DNA-binding transcriptional LysR family regulator
MASRKASPGPTFQDLFRTARCSVGITLEAVDLDLRLVRYFTVVADHGHFGRAAAALHVAQPSLSRQIQRLEEHLGVRLLDRTPQGTRLTEAGAVFRREAETLLRGAGQAAALTRAAAGGETLTVGYTGNLLVTRVVRALRDQHPEADIQTRHLEWDETYEALLGHRVDVVVCRMPLRSEGLQHTVLYEEARVLVVARTHRLAGQATVTLDDIADDPLPRFADTTFNAYWRVDPRPDGRPAPDGPTVAAVEDKFELVAAEQAVCLAPASVARGLRDDLTTVPVEGLDPVEVIVATRAGDTRSLVTAFRETALHQMIDTPAPLGP